MRMAPLIYCTSGVSLALIVTCRSFQTSLCFLLSLVGLVVLVPLELMDEGGCGVESGLLSPKLIKFLIDVYEGVLSKSDLKGR